jgi:hypothetical protein
MEPIANRIADIARNIEIVGADPVELHSGAWRSRRYVPPTL